MSDIRTPSSPAAAETPASSPTQSETTIEASLIEPGPSIRPFQFRASDEALADLRRRLAATIYPDRETVDDGSQGVQLATMR